MKTETFAFEYNGNRLVGVVDLPDKGDPTATVVFVHGHGPSNVDGYADLRQRFSGRGMACCVWDKVGCGQSSGEFDPGQTVQSEAQELVAGIDALISTGSMGDRGIGLWGLSRAGWLCPLAIAERPFLAFWISVSGPDDKENLTYLIETNLRVEGKSEPEVTELVAAWQRGYEALHTGASYRTYLELTRALRQVPFYVAVTAEITKERYLREQARFLSGECTVDEETGLKVYVPDFYGLLNSIRCPVLAIFGEKDTQVDWRKSVALYRDAIGSRPGADLTIRTFPEGNHLIAKCETGGVLEPASEYCDGYVDTMTEWLVERGFGA